eukprot:TRINITY_DN11991_c0_g1_i2.p1 TRINITY_DN11991_c0_g1~~TRINITY_DN11991_c0_g1_i2.p1  ORF type:complete len:186 (-),score=53.73 TRINITY_DN11991_c0_g1_i2:40-597(-)
MRFVHADADSRKNIKKVRTESGAKVDATFVSDRYEKWMKKTHQKIQETGEMETENSTSKKWSKYRHKSTREDHEAKANKKKEDRLRSKDEIQKERRVQAKRDAKRRSKDNKAPTAAGQHGPLGPGDHRRGMGDGGMPKTPKAAAIKKGKIAGRKGKVQLGVKISKSKFKPGGSAAGGGKGKKGRK